MFVKCKVLKIMLLSAARALAAAEFQTTLVLCYNSVGGVQLCYSYGDRRKGRLSATTHVPSNLHVPKEQFENI